MDVDLEWIKLRVSKARGAVKSGRLTDEGLLELPFIADACFACIEFGVEGVLGVFGVTGPSGGLHTTVSPQSSLQP